MLAGMVDAGVGLDDLATEYGLSAERSQTPSGLSVPPHAPGVLTDRRTWNS